MKKKKVLWSVLLVASIALVALWLREPEPEPDLGTGELMQAIVYRSYGPPDVLRVEQVEKMLPRDHQVLIKVRAAAANPLDWHMVRGTPYLMRLDNGLRKPKGVRLGVDVAGEVVAVGKNVTKWKPGDEVFGVAGGAFSEYARASENRLALKPPALSFEQAAAVPVAAITALQGLRDEGQIRPGHKVLIVGASGGVGTFAVQIAKASGAEVTGVCSTRNVDMVRALGADHVIDYTKEDFTKSGQQYDFILDNVSNHSLSDLRRALTPTGMLVPNGGRFDKTWMASGGRIVQGKVMFQFGGQTFGNFLVKMGHEGLVDLTQLIEAGKLAPVIDRSFPLSETAAALDHVGAGHARGKTTIAVDAAAERTVVTQLRQVA
jgi:NADPH:quinone reductase-like Zn-dependent oxidoreductase